jgi:hypothetical protein
MPSADEQRCTVAAGILSELLAFVAPDIAAIPSVVVAQQSKSCVLFQIDGDSEMQQALCCGVIPRDVQMQFKARVCLNIDNDLLTASGTILGHFNYDMQGSTVLAVPEHIYPQDLLQPGQGFALQPVNCSSGQFSQPVLQAIVISKLLPGQNTLDNYESLCFVGLIKVAVQQLEMVSHVLQYNQIFLSLQQFQQFQAPR